ncbi:MAG: hypothetical protein EAZ51_08620 [Sphingobacteriales bacterium]|nr:MAG: hypothetical protein EAZ64_00835 [Sphingobacteriales bacterium]TAF78889.1 MAG: hypothetical protein EAZ51_08620 [Sphingobacteriales bacterium]
MLIDYFAQNYSVKLKPKCGACKKELDNRIPRPVFAKLFIPFLPIKVYKCTHCLRKNYII